MAENEQKVRERQYNHDYYKNKTKRRRLERSGRRYRQRVPGSPMIVFHLSMKKEEHALAKQIATEKGVSMASVMMEAFHQYVERRAADKESPEEAS